MPVKQPVAQHKNLPVTQAGFVRAADNNELHPEGFSRLRLLGGRSAPGRKGPAWQ